MERLANCTLKNGELTIPGVSGSELRTFCDELRRRFMAYEIEYYKPIGVFVTSDMSRAGIGGSSVITKIEGTAEAYVELFNSLGSLSYADIESEVPDEVVKTTSSSRYIKGLYEFLITRPDDVITSSNGSILGCGKGLEDIPQALVPDVHLLTCRNTSVAMRLVCYKSKGFVSFQSASSLVPRGYLPVAQCYDLTTEMFIKRHEVGDKAIHFKYKRKVNEEVLQQILRNNAR